MEGGEPEGRRGGGGGLRAEAPAAREQAGKHAGALCMLLRAPTEGRGVAEPGFPAESRANGGAATRAELCKCELASAEEAWTRREGRQTAAEENVDAAVTPGLGRLFRSGAGAALDAACPLLSCTLVKQGFGCE